MFECFDTHGNKIKRVGKASVKRVLNEPVNITSDSDCDYALVSCPDAGCNIMRDGDVYNISWYDKDGNIVEETDDSMEFVISKFLILRTGAMICSG